MVTTAGSRRNGRGRVTPGSVADSSPGAWRRTPACWTGYLPNSRQPSCSRSATRAHSPLRYTPPAREAVEAQADVIVAQGTEAGGHGMSESLFTLLPQLADACPDTPVVAAGGVADGRGLAAAMMLGAEGVLMGTRFYASQEANGNPEAKRRIVAAAGGQTVRSIVFDLSRGNRWPAPYTGRLLRNSHLDRWLGREDELEAHGEEVGRDYAAARERGDFEVAGVIAGEACALIHDIPPASEIVERIVTEAERLLPPHRSRAG
jgi:nitronate monooxygenase